jgi:hypothetical protein
MKQLFSIIILLLAGFHLSAQRNIPPELEQRLQGKTKVTDIMKEVNRYYDYGKTNIAQKEDGEEEDWEGNDCHWWKKWEYWAMRRQNPDGSLANHRSKNYQAQKEVDRKHGAALRQAEENFRQNYKRPDETGRYDLRVEFRSCKD